MGQDRRVQGTRPVTETTRRWRRQSYQHGSTLSLQSRNVGLNATARRRVSLLGVTSHGRTLPTEKNEPNATDAQQSQRNHSMKGGLHTCGHGR